MVLPNVTNASGLKEAREHLLAGPPFVAGLVVSLVPISFQTKLGRESLEFFWANQGGNQGKFIRERITGYGSRVFKTLLLGKQMVIVCGLASNKFLFSKEGKKAVLWWPSLVWSSSG
ncbi:hypothetical protein ACJRO7_010757 [Eucalyptus globulus]|uniref:Uncharacterized protein n=1 Tax=Eucalyptus globulus TaxID=34317 RepID=A0ABD3LHN7_EUCGL